VPLARNEFLALSIQLLASHKPLTGGITANSLRPAQAGCKFLFVTLDLLFKQSEPSQDV
jgi:hypothetical protein